MKHLSTHTMSDHVVPPDHELDGTAKPSMHDFQAAWMSRWKHKSCTPSSPASYYLQLGGDNQIDNTQLLFNCGPEKASHAVELTPGYIEFPEAGRVGIMDKSQGNESFDSKPLQVCRTSRNQEAALATSDDNGKKGSDDTVTLERSNWSNPEGQCNHLKPKGIVWDPEQQVKSNGLAVLAPFQLNVGSSSKIVPYGFHNKGIKMHSFMSQQEESDQSCPVVTSKEHFTDAKFCSFSTYWIREKGTDTVIGSRKLDMSLSTRRDSSPWLHGTSTSHSQLPTQSPKGEDDRGNGLLPSRGCHPEGFQSVKAYHHYHSLPRKGETVRIQTASDSTEEIPRRTSKFSQTTNEFLITNKTGVNLSSLGQVFRDSNLSFQLKRKDTGFLSLSPAFSFQNQQGVNRQSPWCPKDSEKRGNVGNVRKSTVCLKNESSAETDAMELDAFQKRHLYSDQSCPPNQKTEGRLYSSTSPTVGVSAGEESVDRISETNTKLPDINEPLAVPEEATVGNDREPSLSRTLSLDADQLLSQAEQHGSSKSTPFLDGPQRTEPNSRWVKRLRLGDSGLLALGTKVSTIGERPRGNVNKVFKHLFDNSVASSEPTESKQQIAIDQPLTLPKKRNSSSDSVQKGQDITLSHSWIKRFASKTASLKKKPETVALRGSQSSKATVDEFQKKQFPSIAAMALMGKALTGFSPCEFRRSGSLMVWNT